MRDFEKYLEKISMEENDHFSSPSPKKWIFIIFLFFIYIRRIALNNFKPY